MEESVIINVDEKASLLDSKPPPKKRLSSLDIFRGLTMVGMILVDNQGSPDHVIWPLKETDWDGISTADFIYPFFLWISGFAICLALRNASLKDWKIWFKLLKRAVILFGIGVFLNIWASDFDWAHFNMMGILQRTSICYTILAILYLLIPNLLWLQAIIVLIIFPTIYLLFVYLLYVPGCGKGSLINECNAVQYIDSILLGNHGGTARDGSPRTNPEGLFATLTSCSTMFIGVICGVLMSKYKNEPNRKMLKYWLFVGFAAVIVGVIAFFAGNPVNKKMWSVSFAFCTGGSGAICLSIIYFFVDDLEWKGRKYLLLLLQPSIWLGTNPLLIFIAMIALEILLMDTIILSDGSSAWEWVYENMFASWINNENFASFLVSFIYLILWTIIAGLLYWKGLFFNI
eukprot:TRINITY_DN8921_c0_g1_i1.p1 TRINITY_DN8921_c0_g1~~TRINITY_DN8921_c0_g1_i1.p1  ORF type:complete len:402 (-),score=137.53 TRINITY_DN8921_c0_g1_i1:38-1243(-)